MAGEPALPAGELTGTRALIFAEATALVSRASGLPTTYRHVSPDDRTASLLDRGLDQAAAAGAWER